MYEYKFVEIGAFYSLEETLNSYAKDGWRVVQIMPGMSNGTGPLNYKIVFEREKK